MSCIPRTRDFAAGAPSAATASLWCFQGGGALGAYQAGVYQAMHEAGVEPDWVSGVSIGAINSAIIAGNPRDERIEKLQDILGPDHRAQNLALHAGRRHLSAKRAMRTS